VSPEELLGSGRPTAQARRGADARFGAFFRERKRAAPGVSWTVLGVADYNGDNGAEIALVDSSGDIAEWQMDGTRVVTGGIIGNPGTSWLPVVK